MLASGERPEAVMRPPVDRHRRPPAARNEAAHLTQWPLPDDRPIGPSVPHHQPRPFVPRAPPPPVPLRPSDTRASSIYSERDAPGFMPNPDPINYSLPSFPNPLPYQPPPYSTRVPISSSANSAGLTPHTSATAEEHTRQSAASSVGTIPDFPQPQGPNPAYMHAQHNTRRLTGPRKSSVSPVVEEEHDSSSVRGGSFPSSRAIPPSWVSGPAESEILGAYLDDRSDNGGLQDDNDTLVRQASLGKRGKPSLRTIHKSNPASYVSDEGATRFHITEKEDGHGRHGSNGSNGTNFRDSSSSALSASSHELDLEKSPVFLDVSQRRPAASHDADALKKELQVLPQSGPNMSDRRPGLARPPRLDLGAVRDAEARGSLTSLTDLIRRATKVATRLDHGRTASKADLFDDSREVRPPFIQRLRNSASMSDILASFPNPHPGASESRTSWPIPVLFKRPVDRDVGSGDLLAAPDEKTQRRCCGMRPGWFIFTIVAVIIVIALAVLLPVFLVVVPKENADNRPSCEKTLPCSNGGVSVSSGNTCSCVCTNGFTGSQCMTEGDPSCVTIQVSDHNATMGSDLPRLLEGSRDNFGIPLDSFSLMALFSRNNVSCVTENNLVSFPEVPSKTKRFFIQPDLLHPVEQNSQTITKEIAPTQTLAFALAARDSIATVNGILIDGSPTTGHGGPAITTAPTASRVALEPSSTSTSTPASTASTVTSKTLDFARIAVLYLFQQTGELDTAMRFSDNIQSFLTGPYLSGKAKEYDMNLRDFGVLADFTVNFEEFTIDLNAGGSGGVGSNWSTDPPHRSGAG